MFDRPEPAPQKDAIAGSVFEPTVVGRNPITPGQHAEGDAERALACGDLEAAIERYLNASVLYERERNVQAAFDAQFSALQYLREVAVNAPLDRGNDVRIAGVALRLLDLGEAMQQRLYEQGRFVDDVTHLAGGIMQQAMANNPELAVELAGQASPTFDAPGR